MAGQICSGARCWFILTASTHSLKSCLLITFLNSKIIYSQPVWTQKLNFPRFMACVHAYWFFHDNQILRDFIQFMLISINNEERLTYMLILTICTLSLEMKWLCFLTCIVGNWDKCSRRCPLQETSPMATLGSPRLTQEQEAQGAWWEETVASLSALLLGNLPCKNSVIPKRFLPLSLQ